MAEKPVVTNAMRLLKAAGIDFETREYEVDESDLSGVHHMKELRPLTGYIRGGCSPVGMKKKYPTFLDETCELCDRIAVSAGQRGVQMLLRPADLARYVEAKICDIAQ